MYFNLEKSEMENPKRVLSKAWGKGPTKGGFTHSKDFVFMWPVVTGVSQKVISLHLKVK